MPRPKRYFPVSQDINRDPEMIDFKGRFGLAGFTLWLEILALLDRHENQILMTEHVLRSLCHVAKCRLQTGYEMFNKCVANGWLIPNELLTKDSQIIYRSPNYLKYHRSREPKFHKNGSPPNLTYSSSDLKKDLQKKKEKCLLTKTPKEKPSASTTGPPAVCGRRPDLTKRGKLEAFGVTDALRTWAHAEDMPDPDDYIEEFKDYWRSLPDAKLRVDWLATFKNRLRDIKAHPEWHPREKARQGEFVT